MLASERSGVAIGSFRCDDTEQQLDLPVLALQSNLFSGV